MSQFYAAFGMLFTTFFNLFKGVNNLAESFEKSTDILKVNVETWYEEEAASAQARAAKAQAKAKAKIAALPTTKEDITKDGEQKESA